MDTIPPAEGQSQHSPIAAQVVREAPLPYSQPAPIGGVSSGGCCIGLFLLVLLGSICLNLLLLAVGGITAVGEGDRRIQEKFVSPSIATRPKKWPSSQ